MSKFPEALPLSRKVSKTRLVRKKEMILGARRGVLLRSSIILAELLGFFLFGSSSLLLEGLASLIDVGASLFLIWCIHLADRPPDQNHPLGHGRFEPVAGLLLGTFLIFLGIITGYHQFQLFFLTPVLKTSLSPYAWIIPFLAIGVLEFSYQTLKGTAKQKNSPALLADAIHYRIDALASLFALIALVLAAVIPAKAYLFDHIGAFTISLFMVVIGSIAVLKNLQQLLDQSPPEEDFERVQRAAMKVSGVLATEKVRLQVYGPDAHVAIDIEVDPQLPVEKAHIIAQEVRREIQCDWPQVRDVIVHIEPYYPGDHESRR